MSILRPRLRSVETVVVPDDRFGRAIMLRDSEGVTAQVAVIPPPLLPILARFTGALTADEIAAAASAEMKSRVPVEIVRDLAEQLDEALFLDTQRYRTERLRIEDEFRRACIRPAIHAGGAYHADPEKLAAYVERDCIGRAGTKKANGRALALIAPHIDPWRGKISYGHAYGALRAGLSPDADTFILLGTSHAPMKQPFALCPKAFDTPFGPVQADIDAIEAIAEKASFDAFADLFNHKREHSLEFQAVFVRYLVGDRDVRIIPILCGLGECQTTGRQPDQDPWVEGFFEALRSIVERRADRTVVIAGADLAHVGPRFGDDAPYDEAQRASLAARDGESLELAANVSHRDFFSHVQADLDSRRVCGLGPIYALLRLLPSSARGELAHYEQTIDPEEGSIVSHAAMTYYDR